MAEMIPYLEDACTSWEVDCFQMEYATKCWEQIGTATVAADTSKDTFTGLWATAVS